MERSKRIASGRSNSQRMADPSRRGRRGRRVLPPEFLRYIPGTSLTQYSWHIVYTSGILTLKQANII